LFNEHRPLAATTSRNLWDGYELARLVWWTAGGPTCVRRTAARSCCRTCPSSRRSRTSRVVLGILTTRTRLGGPADRGRDCPYRMLFGL